MTTTLDGTLIRHDDGTWHWRDGTPEPRVSDLTLGRAYNFRCRTYGGGSTCVEVPISVAREQDDLAWVIEGLRANRYETGLDGDRTGPLVIREDGSVGRAHIAPGEDPLNGNEPLPEQPGPIPRVALVPVAEWDARPPCGIAWDCANETDILDRAYALGWRPSDRYTSRGNPARTYDP